MSDPARSLMGWLLLRKTATSADVIEKMRELKMLPPLSISVTVDVPPDQVSILREVEALLNTPGTRNVITQSIRGEREVKITGFPGWGK